MDQDISSNRATNLDFNREETLAVAALLALAGGTTFRHWLRLLSA